MKVTLLFWSLAPTSKSLASADRITSTRFNWCTAPLQCTRAVHFNRSCTCTARCRIDHESGQEQRGKSTQPNWNGGSRGCNFHTTRNGCSLPQTCQKCRPQQNQRTQDPCFNHIPSHSHSFKPPLLFSRPKTPTTYSFNFFLFFTSLVNSHRRHQIHVRHRHRTTW